MRSQSFYGGENELAAAATIQGVSIHRATFGADNTLELDRTYTPDVFCGFFQRSSPATADAERVGGGGGNTTYLRDTTVVAGLAGRQ